MSKSNSFATGDFRLSSELPGEIGIEAQRLNRRQKIAELLIHQGIQPLQPPQSKGRFQPHVSWVEGLAQLTKTGLGGYLSHLNDKEATSLSERLAAQRAADVEAYIKSKQGTPAVPGTPDTQRIVANRYEPGGVAQEPGGPAMDPTASTGEWVGTRQHVTQAVQDALDQTAKKVLYLQARQSRDRPLTPEQEIFLKANQTESELPVNPIETVSSENEFKIPMLASLGETHGIEGMRTGANAVGGGVEAGARYSLPATPIQNTYPVPGTLGTPAQPASHEQLMAGVQAALMSQDPTLRHMAGTELAQSTKPPVKIDVGDKFLLMKDNEVVGVLPKTVSPSEAMKEAGTQKRFEGVSGNAQLQAETAQANARMTAETARGNQADQVAILGPDGTPMPNQAAIDAKTAIAKEGATKIVNTLSQSTEKKYGEQFAGKVADSDVTLRDAAVKAPEAAERANHVRQLLASGKTITGTAAEWRLQFAKAAKLAGLSASDTPETTEVLAAELATNTMLAIKQSGMGGGTGFSNADRDFLEKAVGGKITLEKESMMRLAELNHRAATMTADRWNKRVAKIPKSSLEGTGITSDPIMVPPLHGKATPKPLSTYDPDKERRYQEWKKSQLP